MNNATTGKKPYTRPLTIEELLAIPDEDIIADDVPYDVNDPAAVAAFWDGAIIKKGNKVIGRVGRPLSETKKVSTTIRFDKEVLDAFKAGGKGWQTRMNTALKEWLAAHQAKASS